MPSLFAHLKGEIAKSGFAFVTSTVTQNLLKEIGSFNDWDAFTASWNDLETDMHMADKGRYRKRRYAVYSATADGSITRKPHEPHFQTLDYNPLNGGVERLFAPIRDDIGSSESITTILTFCRDLFGGISHETKAWHIEVHQFRIEAGKEKGQPTPEGLHRDGRDYVLVLLTRRQNIQSGTTTIYDLDKKPLGSFTLTNSFDAALVDDCRVYHGVTPVKPVDPSLPACRDVLVVTFRKS